MFQMYVGDRSPALPIEFEIDGEPVDITDMDVRFWMTDLDTGTFKIVAQAAEVLDGPAGSARYNWTALDADTEARYHGWAKALVDTDVVQTLDLGEIRFDLPGVVTVADVRALVETGLTDDALQILLDDAQETIRNRFGAPNSEVVTLDAYGCATAMLLRPAQSVTLVEERAYYTGTWTTVDPADYVLEDGGRTLRRSFLGDTFIGGYGRWWGRELRVTYVPRSDVATRRRVTIDLVRLGTQYSGLSSEKIGTYAATPLPYTDEREKLLQQIQRTRSTMRFA